MRNSASEIARRAGKAEAAVAPWGRWLTGSVFNWRVGELVRWVLRREYERERRVAVTVRDRARRLVSARNRSTWTTSARRKTRE